jgi:hypothetical protein
METKRVRLKTSADGTNGKEVPLTNAQKPTNGNSKLRLYSEIITRMKLATQLGIDTYDGTRDIYQALGYPKDELTWKYYWSRYKRHDIAKAIIDRPVKASWKGEISVIETVEDKSTPFEIAWKELFDRLKLKSIFIRADKLTGIGRYSVVFLGLNDASTTEAFAKPVSNRTGLKLLYVKPLSEDTAQIATWDENPQSERYGLPLLYTVKIETGSKSFTVTVHYTRVVHLVEDPIEDEVYGTPRLEAVYNRLIDLEKLIGGDAEMFWRGARPGYTGEVNPDYQMTDAMFDDLQAQIDEYENNLRRILINEGVKYNALAQQIADPINHVDVQIQMISAVTGIPKRILTGSERGELSSAQDKLEWISYVTSRREEQNEPMILRPFIDKCIEIGVLPKPTVPYTVRWDKLFSLSDEEKTAIGKNRTFMLKEYSSPTSVISEYIPLDLFCKMFLNLDDTQVQEIVNNMQRAIEEEKELNEEEIEMEEDRMESQQEFQEPSEEEVKKETVTNE